MAEPPSKKPADTAFKQQRLPACRPIFTPLAVGLTFFAVGIPFVIVGRVVSSASSEITELSVQYDGDGATNQGCQIDHAGASKSCKVSMTAPVDMAAPVYVYYQLSNFYQNHRRYVKSYDRSQLLGCTSTSGGSCSAYAPSTQCDPLVNNGTLLLNPCGLIANSLFNDVILVNTPGLSMQYDGTAWATDENKYHQPEGFEYQEDDSGKALGCYTRGKDTLRGGAAACADCTINGAFYDKCKAYQCTPAPELSKYYGCSPGKYYLFVYPEPHATQYLYESFPEVATPMMGVETNRFQVWMRVAALPKFRKLYGIINTDIKANTNVEFMVKANFDVTHFGGTKSLVLTTSSWFGGKNEFLGTCFTVVGSLCLAFGVGFLVKQCASPRILGDLTHLS
jgi:hypothetical protein